MGRSSNGSRVTIIVAVIGAVATITVAVVGASWFGPLLFGGDETAVPPADVTQEVGETGSTPDTGFGQVEVPGDKPGGDQCPDDPDKTQPGECGCGVPDTDSDGDGIPDCIDGCPNDPDKTQPGVCGCDSPDTDSDGDGTPDCSDQCPDDPNKTQPGECGCGIPDDGLCVIPPSAVAYYGFDGNGTDQIGDSTAIIQGATFTTGRDGTSFSALEFDGIDDFVQLPNESAFDLTEFTIIIWLRLDSLEPVDGWIISKGPLYGNFTIMVTGSDAQYWAGYASYVHVTQGGNWSSVASQEPLPIGEFFCLAISLDSSSFRSYINGQLARSAGNVSPPLLNDSPVYVGAGGYYDVSEYFRGIIDEVQIYSRVLSDSEIAQQCQ